MPALVLVLALYIGVGVISFIWIVLRHYVTERRSLESLWRFLRTGIMWREEYMDILAVVFLWPKVWREVWIDFRAEREIRRREELLKAEQELERQRRSEIRKWSQKHDAVERVPIISVPRRLRPAEERRRHRQKRRLR